MRVGSIFLKIVHKSARMTACPGLIGGTWPDYRPRRYSRLSRPGNLPGSYPGRELLCQATISTRLPSGSPITLSKKPSPVVRGSLKTRKPSSRNRRVRPCTASTVPALNATWQKPVHSFVAGEVISVRLMISSAALWPNEIGFETFSRVDILFAAFATEVGHVERPHLFETRCPKGYVCDLHTVCV
mgnify:CR=1 FL=1